MQYNKPQIVKLDEAVQAIQASTKVGIHTDLDDRPTNCAYEADE